MEEDKPLKILFFINPNSGKQDIDWEQEIKVFFKELSFSVEIVLLNKNFKPKDLLLKIEQSQPDRVVAVGGDGTVNAVAQSLIHTNLALGIVPAGSANGMAKEFNIGANIPEILTTLISGEIIKIHVLKVNENLCLHLSDVGFNARMIEKFQSQDVRGFWGYLKASINVARNGWFQNKVHASMLLDDEKINLKAGMIVIANATKYGSGAVINPNGDLEDDFFEIVVVKKVSIIELFKMMLTHSKFNPQKIKVYKAKKLYMKLPRENHFQIDGEYIGKVTEINAHIIPQALQVLIPKKQNQRIPFLFTNSKEK